MDGPLQHPANSSQRCSERFSKYRQGIYTPLPPPDGSLTSARLDGHKNFTQCPCSFRNMLQDAARPAVEVKALTEGEGFRFVDGLVIPSACILLGGSVFLWDVPAAPTDLRWQEWKTDHFKLFELLTVKPGRFDCNCERVLSGCNPSTEILLVGTGKRVVPVASHLKKYLNSLGIQVDAYDSVNSPASLISIDSAHSGMHARHTTC
jgi:NADH dehydrogenase [ubiquinone] 1 alpha subcomplex assembly factor 3